MIHIEYSPEVAQARAENRPLVALESTIITHGMPFPQNVETARRVEAEIRMHGAVPATIAVLGGTLHVGLTDAQLDRLGQARDVAKLSRADFAACIARGGDGATTVAATMIAAHLAGIEVFATGGIGGVHRGGEATLDVSADLYELARTRGAVVCSGAKAILDLGRTLELLESFGVPVIGFATDTLPAFYSASSPHAVSRRVDDEGELARLLAAHWGLGVAGSVLVANPPPRRLALAGDEVERWIETAHAEAVTAGVAGAALTPFLLARLAELSGGRTVAVNRALLAANAALAGRIAVAWSRLPATRGGRGGGS